VGDVHGSAPDGPPAIHPITGSGPSRKRGVTAKPEGSHPCPDVCCEVRANTSSTRISRIKLTSPMSERPLSIWRPATSSAPKTAKVSLTALNTTMAPPGNAQPRSSLLASCCNWICPSQA